MARAQQALLDSSCSGGSVGLSHGGHRVQDEVANCSEPGHGGAGVAGGSRSCPRATGALLRLQVRGVPVQVGRLPVPAAVLRGPGASRAPGCRAGWAITAGTHTGLVSEQTELGTGQTVLSCYGGRGPPRQVILWGCSWHRGSSPLGQLPSVPVAFPRGCGEMGSPESLCPCPGPGVGAGMVWAQRVCWPGGGTPEEAVSVSSSLLLLNSSLGCGVVPLCPVFTWWWLIQLFYKCLVLFSLNKA